MLFRVPVAVIAVLIALVSLTPHPARAGESAEQLIKKGLEMRKRGDDLGAFPLFDEAYRTSPTPRAAAQRAFCAQALGRWTQVENDLTEALKSPDDAWVRKNRAAIDESLREAKMKVAVIEVVGDPPGSEVLVNGKVVGQLPLATPVRIEAGEIDIELRSAGNRHASKSLHVEGGQYQRIVVRVEAEVVTPPAAQAAPAAAPAAGPSNVSVYFTQPTNGAAGNGNTTVTTRPAEPVSAWSRAPKWISWGLGAAALGVGAYGYARYRGQLDDFNGDCAFDQNGAVYSTNPMTRTTASCEGLRDNYRSGRTIAIVGGVGAGALLVTGFVFYMFEPKASEGRTALSCAPDVGSLDRLSLGCSLRF